MSTTSTTPATSTTSTPSAFGIGSGLSTAPGTTASSSSTNTLNANSFMTLFLAQLQNQDPTNPMQSYELAAQLAQFTTVQELNQAATLLGTLQQYTAGINNGQIAALVGQQVTAQSSTINVTSGTPSALSYTLSAPATVTVTITDSTGATVNTLNLGSQSAGSYSVPWTGTDSNGNTVADGAYTCTATATGSDGTSSPVVTGISGQVYSCNLNNNPPTYTLSGPNGIQVPIANVFAVTGQSNTTNTSNTN
ncbi:MAG: FlgD immunoglobulin-like domain containing protein [Syntrophobacteraceae bacterium]